MNTHTHAQAVWHSIAYTFLRTKIDKNTFYFLISIDFRQSANAYFCMKIVVWKFRAKTKKKKCRQSVYEMIHRQTITESALELSQ